ncbi:MAG: ABC transporter ATP-binding protein [Nitrospirota bacterium]
MTPASDRSPSTATGTDVLLEVDGLAKYFPVRSSALGLSRAQRVHAVDGVSFHINRGEVLGLVGESGCGKSTTGRLILRLIDPSAGSIRFLGEDLLSAPAARMKGLRRHLQIVFQDPFSSLNPRMRIGTILEEPLVVHGLGSRTERADAVRGILEKVGLSADALTRYPHEFSGGQRQRVGIARALILNPQLVVADEPVSSLDVSIQAQIINLLQDLQRAYRLSLLFIAHDLVMVRHISDRVAVMYLGRIVELASSDALFARPRHPYTQALIAAIPTTAPGVAPRATLLDGDPPSPINLPTGCRFYSRCPKRIPECRQVDPQLTQIADGHSVACILPDANT